ncbi:hypothetical protein BU15DRAFT_68214 [Melanogaster broomeanus]|nr:hypothetical protein BU15DRAFT_68214 [Melanogaster broomeanus]
MDERHSWCMSPGSMWDFHVVLVRGARRIPLGLKITKSTGGRAECEERARSAEAVYEKIGTKMFRARGGVGGGMVTAVSSLRKLSSGGCRYSDRRPSRAVWDDYQLSVG